MVNDDLEIEIVEVYEIGSILNVRWRCKYGESTFGLGLHTKKINLETGRPYYEEETAKLVREKFCMKKAKAHRIDIGKEDWGKKLKVKGI